MIIRVIDDTINNETAYVLGLIARKVARKRIDVGDEIDRGLLLIRELDALGYLLIEKDMGDKT
jgi:hypothetical protein